LQCRLFIYDKRNTALQNVIVLIGLHFHNIFVNCCNDCQIFITATF